MKRYGVFLAGVMCCLGIGYSDQSGSLVVSPGSDVRWGCTLQPYETANLEITIAPAPDGYQLKDTIVSITNNRPGFCWSGGYGGYSVVNTICTSATTRVVVKCIWEPIPGEGGSGSGGGTPLPNLKGSATGTANARPGEYWNEAEAPEVAVGNLVTVNAYTNNGPAPSSWSISGPASIQGAGASAEVTGTAPSANEFDVNVHSVCNATGQTDDEYLTVVGVVSIEADPDVVCVGDANVSYTITTQPAGYNYMVEYEPADTSTPGIKEVVATCGSSAATCTVTVIQVETETFVTSPPDRTRKKLGVGEEVKLTLKPTGLTQVRQLCQKIDEYVRHIGQKRKHTIADEFKTRCSGELLVALIMP